jgi:hypothetical protein
VTAPDADAVKLQAKFQAEAEYAFKRALRYHCIPLTEGRFNAVKDAAVRAVEGGKLFRDYCDLYSWAVDTVKDLFVVN